MNMERLLNLADKSSTSQYKIKDAHLVLGWLRDEYVDAVEINVRCQRVLLPLGSVLRSVLIDCVGKFIDEERTEQAKREEEIKECVKS